MIRIARTRCCHGAVVLAILTGTAAHAATLHVPGDYPTIKAAVNAASNGDVIVVAPGTYTGNGNNGIKTMGKKVTLRSAEGAATCTIEGSAFEFYPGDTADTVIDGFTIRRATSGTLGGAISMFNASPTIRNCVITDCSTSPISGGAIGIYGQTSLPLIEHCIFADNSTSMGGAVSLSGGAQVVIKSSIFSANISTNGYGGGVYVGPDCEATVESCIFVGNSVSGLYSEGGFSDPDTVVNCLFTGNAPGNFSVGGGVHSLAISTEIINCTFTGNVGSAVGKRATIVNSILADSVSSSGQPLGGQMLGSLGDLTISFSAVEGGWTGPGSDNIDVDPEFPLVASGAWTLAPSYDAAANLTVYTDAGASFEPGALVGRVMNPDTAQQRRQYIAANTATTISVHGNFTPEPGAPANLLVDANDAYAIFDVRPVAGSPVIDAGNNAALPRSVIVDLDGQARFVDDPTVVDTGAGRGPIVDMGAFERQVAASPDLNGDGAVNPIDLGILLGAWGTSNSNADLDGDGVVGASDLAMLLGGWTG